ncbi:MAG TPA: hypothetical protein VGQ75_02115 [Thermoanaerobaculia bacterium]|jgi:hypothetical protein|nr:hypothetical protein [Thermoanaerobaculia bacterium]
MKSVADRVREEQREQVGRMPVSERLALAFRLAEDDLQLFAAAGGHDRATAMALLRRARRHGRRASGCLDEPV